jgi:hypothetical protein
MYEEDQAGGGYTDEGIRGRTLMGRFSPDGEVSPALVGGSSSAVPGGVMEGSVFGETPAAAPLAMEVAAPSASPIAGAVVPSVLVVGVRSARSLWTSSARLRSSSLTRRKNSASSSSPSRSALSM